MSTTDERLERYLHDRSATIDLPHAGVDAITRRARRHRRRRTAALGGAVAAVMLGGTAIVIAGVPDDDVTSTADKAASVGASPLEWSIVPVQTGIGWGSTAISDGEAVYSLSTAPGPESINASGQPRRLYRSEDGTDWAGLTLPDGLFASSVAAEDGTVYAVGTAAAGGETVGVELATSADGGAGWDSADVPLDLAALADGFPGRVTVTDAEVASAGDTTVVAVSTAGIVDVAALVPADEAESWYQGRGGLTKTPETPGCVWTDPAPTTTVPAEDAPPPANTEPPASTEAPTTAPADPGSGAEAQAEAETSERETVMASGAVECEGQDPGAEMPVPEQRTWADLGLTAEQAALADGQTRLFVTGPDGTLVASQTIDQGSYADPSSSRLLAADDGWWLVDTVIDDAAPSDVDMFSTDIVAWSSADGTTWAPETLATGESTLATGVVDGRPVVIGYGTNGHPVTVHRIEGPGAVSTVDISELLGVSEHAGIYAYGVGPAGVAMVIGDAADDRSPLGDLEVVHSADGIEFGRQPLPDAEPGTKDAVNGITITPDAIKVRLNVRDEGDDGTTPARAQRLFVGTPAG